MKSNKIKSLLGVALVSLCLTSCGDFLEIEPKTFVSEDNFWNEKTDIDQMVAGVYTKMQNDAYIRRCIMWGETRSDNIGEGLNCSGQTDIYRTLKEYLLSTNSFTDWTPFYSVINQCNIIITRAPEVSEKDPTYTQSDVLATQAEMSFLRALSYFYLVRAFKDVPYYTYAIQSDDDAAPIAATDGDEIVRNLIADLESVVSNALKAYPEDYGVSKSSSTYYNTNRNRVTQNAIYSLLADLCLWDGQYQKCIDYAQKVIDAKCEEYEEEYSNSTSMTNGRPSMFKWDDDTYSKGYPLYPCFSGTSYGNDFDEIFGNGSSFESIFELAFTYDGTSSTSNCITNSACAALYGNHYQSGTKGANSGQGYLAAYETIVTDLSESTFKVFLNKYDSRYYENIFVPINTTSSTTTAYPNKFASTSVTVETQSGQTLPFAASYGSDIYANRNWIFYRLTDVMLMQAEALIESATYDEYQVTTTAEDGSTTPLLDANGDQVYEENLKKAFALIYAVNRRSIMVNSTSNTNAKSYDLKFASYQRKGILRSLCLSERRRELMFEGKRWFDLLRYCHREGSVDYIKNTVPSKSGGSTPVSYEALFWPYNKYVLKNNSLLTQKAYYGDDDSEGDFSSTN